MRRQVECDGSLSFDRGPSLVALRGLGRTLVLEGRDLRSLADLLAAGPGGRRVRDAARVLHDVLVRGGLSLEIRGGRRRLALLGSDARPTLIARLAGIRGAELGWRGLFLAVRLEASCRWGRLGGRWESDGVDS